MSWNHRVMRHVEPDGKIWFGIHEVYYDDDNNIEGWTQNSQAPFGETPEELRTDLEQMMDAFEHPILEHNATPKGFSRD